MPKPQMRLRKPRTKKEQAALLVEYGVYVPRRGEITFPQPKGNDNGQAPTDRRVSETVPQHAPANARSTPPDSAE